jgi:LuxR family maltose regulon positive regulatory protein
LEWLVDNELFTVRTGVGWYRYHELFREVLQVELRRAHPDLVPELHRRAGEWLFDHGDPVAAVTHALAAGRYDVASDWLIASSGRLLVKGQMATVLALGELIDDAVSEVPLPVAGTMAVAGIFSGLPGSEIDRLFARFQDRIAADMERIPASGSAWDWPGFGFRFHHDPQELYATIRAVTAQRAGDFESIMDQAAHIPTEAGFVEATVGRVLTWREQYSDAEPLLNSFLGSMSSPRNPLLHTRARAKGLIALAWAGEGRLSEAEELVFQVRDELRTKSLDEIRPVPDVLLAHAQVTWERGALAAAEQAAAEALRGASHLGEMASFALAVILMSRILGSRGDRSGADEALDQGAVMPPGHPVPDHIRERLEWERSRLALNDGDLVGAEIAVPDWRERMGRGATTMREHLLLARFAIAAGEDASALLDQPPPRCEVTISHRIQLGLLKSLAAVARGVRDDALDELTMAFEIAAHTGHRQRFLDERPTLGALLDNAAARAGISLQSGVADDVVVIDLSSSPPASDDRAGDLESIQLLDPLTGRELDVVRLLPSHRSYAAIGNELGVSINTVKYHVKAIYRKLDATSRSEAVDKAQRRGLLPTRASRAPSVSPDSVGPRDRGGAHDRSAT